MIDYKAILTGLCLMALGASSKAIVDVAKLQENSKNNKEVIKETRQMVYEIHRHLLKGN